MARGSRRLQRSRYVAPSLARGPFARQNLPAHQIFATQNNAANVIQRMVRRHQMRVGGGSAVRLYRRMYGRPVVRRVRTDDDSGHYYW